MKLKHQSLIIPTYPWIHFLLSPSQILDGGRRSTVTKDIVQHENECYFEYTCTVCEYVYYVPPFPLPPSPFPLPPSLPAPFLLFLAIDAL